METREDAPKLLDMMRNVSSEPMRLGLLVALDKSPKHCLISFVQGNGVEILEKWLRQSAEARYACLLVLQKLPVTLTDLQKADSKSLLGGKDIIPTVEAIQGQDQVETHRNNASTLLDRWRAGGLLAEPPPKRRRVETEPSLPRAPQEHQAEQPQQPPQPEAGLPWKY
eukprot:Skav226752  [mRNA]  locus=scaffold3942:89473:90689:- [translate_table: standard]